MFDKLYVKPACLARHLSAPYAEERSRYLLHCAKQGYTKATLLLKARELLWVARKLSVYGGLRVTLNQIEAVAGDWAEREKMCGQRLDGPWTRVRFVQVARPWVRFLGHFDADLEPPPFGDRLEAYAGWMERDRGLAANTLKRTREALIRFLRWYGQRQQAFEAVRLEDIDAYLAEGCAAGWSRRYARNVADNLRRFYRFAGRKGWCSATLADAIRGPRVYAHDGLPLGPSWPEVQRLLASANTGKPADIRDQAILILFAVYGLRAGEVGGLTLDDFDWEQDRLYVARAKGRGRQVYPLLPSLGNAIARYLKEVRSASVRREVFLTLLPPFRPLSRGALYSLTRLRLTRLGIRSAHLGPHALRHACATRLASEGLSLKVIGDHLGHRSVDVTRIYAKVDLSGLREVAAFDLGDLP